MKTRKYRRAFVRVFVRERTGRDENTKKEKSAASEDQPQLMVYR